MSPNRYAVRGARLLPMQGGGSVLNGSNRARRTAHHGFTLIELLVVITVIAILAGLVAPMVFSHVGDAKTSAARAQIELHPALPQASLRAFHSENGIVTESYSPLAVGRLVSDRTVGSVAEKYGRTPAQVLLRWNLQLGNRIIPKSVRPQRIQENIDIFDFSLADEDMALLTGLGD